jgi:hypothetical protein
MVANIYKRRFHELMYMRAIWWSGRTLLTLLMIRRSVSLRPLTVTG